MWTRNVLFIGTGIVGLAALVATIWLGDPRPRAGRFDPALDQRAGFRSVVDQVNAEFEAHWKASSVEPASRAPDLKIARRISLGLTGTIPSLEEIREFERQPKENRVSWWVSHVLADRRYADHVGERLKRAYVGVENGPFLVYRERRFRLWLSDRLAENMPYDKLVRTLIESEGVWTSNPEVNFITVTNKQGQEDEGPDEIKLAARVSRAFLGVRIDCVQCHDDNLGGPWKQTDFHELAAFFAGTNMTLTGARDKPTEYQYKYLYDDEESLVPQQVPFQRDLLPASGAPRQRLARWVTHPENRAFARAAVNRVWALMFGRPLVEPIDDIPLEPSKAPGMETLADDFLTHGYDLQRLIRVIAATEAFQVDSRAEHEITQEHQRHWASFPLSRLRPEQVSGSLLQAASLKTIDTDSHIFTQLAQFNQQSEFINRYGDTGEDEFADRGGTIPQRLLMMNGQLLLDRTKTKDDAFSNASSRISALAPDNRTAVEVAYLCALSRRPTAGELAHFVQRLGDSKGDERGRRMEDLYWTLLNSTEFSWNH